MTGNISFSRNDIDELINASRNMRINAIKMAFSRGAEGAHISGSLSCIEIYAALFIKVLNLPCDRALWYSRDRFIAGKEHARLAEYSALSEAGLISFTDTLAFEADGGLLTGHKRNIDIGIEYSSCSLGLSLSYAVGKALQAKINNCNYRIYALVGDGECDEGSVWEAVMAAAHFNLDNLTVIIDRNGMSVDGNTEEIMAQLDMKKKFEAFGWEASDNDGHDFYSLLPALLRKPVGKPYVVIAKTVKGKGVPFIENKKEWHQASINEEQYNEAIEYISGKKA